MPSRFKGFVLKNSPMYLKLLCLGMSLLNCFWTNAMQSGQPPSSVLAMGKAGTVFIKTSFGSGTGFIFDLYDDHYYVATNAHVVVSTQNVKNAVPDQSPLVVVFSGRPSEKVIPAELVAHSSVDDVAILKFPSKGLLLTQLELAGDYEYLETTPFISIGFPFGERLGQGGNPAPTISLGRISSLRYDQQTKALSQIQLDTNLNPGNSGGPILNWEGKVIGMAVSTVLGTDISFAIPLEVIDKVLEGTIGDFAMLGMKLDYQNKLATAKYQLILADPFEQIEQVRFTELKRAPSALEIVAPYSHLPGETWEFNLNQPPYGFSAKRAMVGRDPIWYQFSIKRYGESSWEFLPPMHFPYAEIGILEVLSDSPRMQKERLPEKEASLNERIHPSAVENLSSSWVSKLRKKLNQPKTLALPDRPTQLFQTSGGQYLIMEFPKIQSVGVLDYAAAKITQFFHFEEPFIFGAGGKHIVFYFPTLGRAETYLLSNGKIVSEGDAEFRGEPKALMMGANHSHRVIVFSYSKEKRKYVFDLMDAKSFEVIPVRMEIPLHRGEFQNPLINNDATAFVLSTGLFKFFGSDRIHSHGKLTPRSLIWTEQNFFISAEGEFRDKNFNRLNSFDSGIYPSREGHFYLKQTRSNFQLEGDLVIHAFGNDQFISKTNIVLDKPLIRNTPFPMILFSEKAEVVTYFNIHKNQIEIYPLSLNKYLGELGLSYLFITSRPHTNIPAKKKFAYQVKTFSNSKELSYRLTSHPRNMTISEEGLITWTPSKDLPGKSHEVVLEVLSSDNVKSKQSFTLKVE